MDNKNYRQSCILAHLRQERDKTATKFNAKDQQIIQRDQNP